MHSINCSLNVEMLRMFWQRSNVSPQQCLTFKMCSSSPRSCTHTCANDLSLPSRQLRVTAIRRRSRAHDSHPMKYFILKIFLTLRSTSTFHLDTSYAMALWRVRDAHHIETNYIFYSQHTAPAVFVPLLTGKWLGCALPFGGRSQWEEHVSSHLDTDFGKFLPFFLFQFRSQEICNFHSEKVY